MAEKCGDFHQKTFYVIIDLLKNYDLSQEQQLLESIAVNADLQQLMVEVRH